MNEHTAAGREIEELIAPLLRRLLGRVISEAECRGVADPEGRWSSGRATEKRNPMSCRSIGPSSIILACDGLRDSTDSRSISTATCL